MLAFLFCRVKSILHLWVGCLQFQGNVCLEGKKRNCVTIPLIVLNNDLDEAQSFFLKLNEEDFNSAASIDDENIPISSHRSAGGFFPTAVSFLISH